MKKEDIAILAAAGLAAWMIVRSARGTKTTGAQQYGTYSPQSLIDLNASQGVFESPLNGGMSLAPSGWLTSATPAGSDGSNWSPARAYGSI